MTDPRYLPPWGPKELLEYAEGDIQNVFGPEFAIIDTYKRRVRLPMRDYLLVTRVTDMRNAIPNKYTKCSMTTEYDLPIDGEFSKGGDIPWCILVESGQCDLMLISYLGVDFQNKGERVYRLLNTSLTFYDVAIEGETLRYEIHIDSFANEGDKLLFFFHYDCYVGNRLIVKMRGGCAGFFTDEELAEGKGVLFTPEELEYRSPESTNSKKLSKIESSLKIVEKELWKQTYCNKTEQYLLGVNPEKTSFTPEDMSKLCDRKWSEVYGTTSLCGMLDGEFHFTTPKILMIDQISKIDPKGGVHGLGLIIGEKFLEPDHWYFPCHFKDDEVMAGSLVSEGVSQLLRMYMIWTGALVKHITWLNGGWIEITFHPNCPRSGALQESLRMANPFRDFFANVKAKTKAPSRKSKAAEEQANGGNGQDGAGGGNNNNKGGKGGKKGGKGKGKKGGKK